MLERIGLDDPTAAVYRALLREPEAGAEELALRLRVPRGQVDSALQRLVTRGLALPGPGERVRPVSPEVGLAALLAREEEGLRRLRSEVATFTEDHRRRREHASAAAVEVLEGPDQVEARLADLLAGTERELLLLVVERPPTAGPGDSTGAAGEDTGQESGRGSGGGAAGPAARLAVRTAAEAAERERDALVRLRSRGVDVRTVHPSSAVDHAGSEQDLVRLVEGGCGVRTTPAVPARASIHDRRVALVASETGNPDDAAVLVSTPGVVAAMVALFELLWRDGEAPFDASRTQAEQPRPAELELLSLLLAGHTDESSARHLQVSARTVRRMLTELQRKAHAGSRFELAARSVALGWLPVD